MELPPPGLRARLFVAAQHLIPQHLLTRIVYMLTRSRVAPVKNFLIRGFVRAFHPDMSEAEQADPGRYPTFNAFFTRGLRPGARPIDPNPSTLVAPVDAEVSQIGRLEGARILQAKGHDYSLAMLLGVPAASDAAARSAGAAGSPANAATDAAVIEAARSWTGHFVGGAFATLYLAPFNYHRIHMPLPGALRAAWYVPGRLYSVNATTARAVPELFARNERIVCIFDSGPMSFALVLVGALFVGSMETVWHGEITPRKPRRLLELPPQKSTAWLAKGAEMGRFNMGSTVILLLPPETIDWSGAVQPGSALRLGQPLALLRPRMFAGQH